MYIEASRPYGRFSAGSFERLDGIVHGALAPTERITDFDKAVRDAHGRISYRARFTLIMPAQATAGNGALLVDVVNRGQAVSHMFYNSPRNRPIGPGNLDEGTGFLQNRGYTVLALHWELGEGFEPPCFIDADGQRRFIEGTAFAAIRDLAIFLRNDRSAANPLAGRITRCHAIGYSQTARLLKTFLALGFNQAHGTHAFDGFHLVAGTAGVLPLNASGKGPGSVAAATPSLSDPMLRGVHEEPFTYASVMRGLRETNDFTPRIVVTNMNTDYLSTRTSLVRTGPRGTADEPLPENVRMYDIAGAAHLNQRSRGVCLEEVGQLDWSPALRAQLVALDDWVLGKAEPPASRLMPLEPLGDDPRVLGAPAYLPDAIVQVPRVDSDGNSLGGVRLPDFEVPLGQHGDLNAPLGNIVCRLAGSYRPFARTIAERQASGDARPSLEERYPGGLNEYTSRIRSAGRALVADRLLLEEDRAVIENAAAENPLFPPTPVRAGGLFGGRRP